MEEKDNDKNKFREEKEMKQMNKKGWIQFITVGLVLAVGLAIVLFIFAGSGGLSATFRASQTFAGVINILAQIPPVAWIIIGVFCLLSMLRRR